MSLLEWIRSHFAAFKQENAEMDQEHERLSDQQREHIARRYQELLSGKLDSDKLHDGEPEA